MGDYGNNLEVNSLIERVRSGENEAFERLLDMYKPLLDSSVSRFIKEDFSKGHKDDLYQEAILVFYNAIMNYELCNDGVEFGLYAKICVNNALITQVKNLSKRKAEQLIAEIDEETSITCEEPSDRIIEEESLQKIDSVILKNLSALEYRVWCLYASGRTAKEIGESIGKSEKSAAIAVYRIRKKLRRLFK